MNLTRQQILELSAALRRLDGERGKSYKFGAKIRLQLAQRLRRLAEPVADFQDVQKKMTAQYGLTGQQKVIDNRVYPLDDPGKTRLYNLEWNEFMRETQELQVGSFLLADLDLQNNNVSVQVLAHLLRVISDIPKPPTAILKLTLNDIHGAARAFGQLETDTREFKASYTVKLNLAEIWRRMALESDKAEVRRQAEINTRKLGNYRQNADKLWEVADEPAALKSLEDWWNAEKAKTLELELPVVKVSELDLDTNDIPGSALSDLLPVLAEDPEPVTVSADG